jgi:hypothetical protein
MSSPYQGQSSASPDPRNGQPLVPSQPSQPSQNVPPPYWQPPPPAPKQNNGLAIAALIVASLAMLMGLGGFVSQMLLGAMLGGMSSLGGGFSPADGGLKGTAPQVAEGQSYRGLLLQDEVARVVRIAGGDPTSVSCPATDVVVAGAVAECHGVMDGSSWTFRVTFDDGLGHFTLDEKVD